MAVAAARLSLREGERLQVAAIAAERLAAVLRAVHRARHDEDVVGILRIDDHADVIAGAADEGPIPAHHIPGRARVVGAPHRPLVRGLNQRIHAVAVGWCDLDVDLADVGLRKSLGQLGPLRSAVLREVDGAARAAAELTPRVLLGLPRPREQDIGVLAVHREAGASGLAVHEEDALPVRAAVRRLEDAALILRPGHAADGADIDDVGIGRMDDHTRDAACLGQAHVLPGLAGVLRHVHAVAHHIAVPDDPRLARADPDDVRVARCDRDRANRGDRLIIEDRLECLPGVRGFPQTAGRRAQVVDVGIAGDSRHRRDTPRGRGSHVTKFQRLRRRGLLRSCGCTASLCRRHGRQSRRTQHADCKLAP